jgi:glycosyltransferase involved in cell wall biosynthesis
MKLGFACAWDASPELTWSHTPWQLRAALRERGGSQDEVVDLGVSYPPALRSALQAATARRHDGRWVSMWRHSRPARHFGEAAIRRALQRTPCDVVLQIQDLAALETPYLLYQDLSYDVLLERAETPDGLIHFPTLSLPAVLRLRDRQRAIYDQAAGVLTMSRWFADHLVARSGLPAEKVRVVHPGATAAQGLDPDTLAAAHQRRVEGPRHRLLFVGRDFHAKAGELVVAALAVLRREVDPRITLTVVGPLSWALPGEVPDGVRFLGRLPVGSIGALYDQHDLFVLPSRFEGFGISFVEALAHGLPCVGRDAFAMAEIIKPGANGDLVTADDPTDLAHRIAALLADPALYQRTYAAAGEVARHYSWSRAADDVLAAARAAVGAAR